MSTWPTHLLDSKERLMLPREETTKMVVEDLQNEGDFATVGVVEYGHWLTGDGVLTVALKGYGYSSRRKWTRCSLMDGHLLRIPSLGSGRQSRKVAH
jgi:hypothetical protein